MFKAFYRQGTFPVLFLAMLLLSGSASAQTPTAADADFNGNGEVDIADFLQFVDAYGSQTGDANYDAKFDLDGNDIIGIPDFLIFVDLYGQTVSQANALPIAYAGEYQSVDTGDLVILNGANSRDPEGQPLTFVWRQVEGPQVTLSDPNIARPTFRTSEAGHYAFELVVHDGGSASRPDTVAVDAATISEDAVFAGGDDAAFTYKETMNDSIMVFTAQAGAPQVQVGEVMVNTVEPYFLKKVTRVIRQNASEIVVETEDAALTDVVEEASIRQTFRFPAATKLGMVTPGGIDLPKGCIEIFEDEENKEEELFSLCATATNIAVPIPEITFDSDITRADGIKFVDITAAVTFRVDCALEMTVQKAVFKKKEINVLESKQPALKKISKFVDVIVKFGSKVAVPVGFQIEPDLVLGVETGISAKGELKADINIDRTIEVGIKYHKDTGFSPPVKQEGEGLKIEIEEISLTGKAYFKAYARGEIDVYLGENLLGNEAKLGGGTFGIGPFVELDTSIKAPPPTIHWNAYLGLDGELELYGPEVSINWAWIKKFWKDPKWKVVFWQKPFIALKKFLLSGSILFGDTNFAGITYDSDNDKFYVLHSNAPEPGGKVYEASKNQDGSWEYNELFDVDERIGLPAGIAIYPSLRRPIVYVVGFDKDDNSKLYVYSMDNNNEWEQSGVEDLLDENRSPLNGVTGVTFFDGRFYMVDAENDKVYVYKYHEQLDWWHDQSKDFNLANANGYPLGITYANGLFYVVDGDDDKVYAYNSSGARFPGFDLDPNNSNPSGITYANNRLYVVNGDDNAIYEYRPETPTIITDANLRAVIADSLGKTSGEAITSADMATLTHLDASNKGVRNLTGLEQAINLTWLDLGSVIVNDEWVNSNAISDLSPLSGLTRLEYLDIDSNSITTISSLSGLTSLEYLDLGSNSISDLSALSGLTRLKTLGLYSSGISDLSALSGLTSLEYLVLDSNSITTISTLSGLTSLEYLDLDRNSISDLSALSGLTNLERLFLDDNSIAAVSALSGLTSLEVLFLDSNSISDLSALSGLTSLRALSLDDNSISAVSALSGLTSLLLLALEDNSISNLAPLVANTGLGSGDLVDVRNNPLSTTSLYTHIPTLQARGVDVYFGASKPAVGEKETQAAMKMFGADAWERYGSIYRRRVGKEKDVVRSADKN